MERSLNLASLKLAVQSGAGLLRASLENAFRKQTSPRNCASSLVIFFPAALTIPTVNSKTSVYYTTAIVIIVRRNSSIEGNSRHPRSAAPPFLPYFRSHLRSTYQNEVPRTLERTRTLSPCRNDGRRVARARREMGLRDESPSRGTGQDRNGTRQGVGRSSRGIEFSPRLRIITSPCATLEKKRREAPSPGQLFRPLSTIPAAYTARNTS